MYNIIGISQQGAEVIDTADNRIEAVKLVNEYKMAFGSGWIIKFKRK
tara:strand:- start:739 stop:879 length:141 start_codon:yes stop_codon:yes gene_type:complete